MGNRKLIIGSLAIGLALAAGAAGYVSLAPSHTEASETSRFQTITPLQARTLIETRADLQIIDVRSPEEFRQGALPGSVLIPFWDFMKGRSDLPKDKPLLLVCAVGGRSLAVGQMLATQGYPEIYNLKGGLEAWIKQRVPLPKPAPR